MPVQNLQNQTVSGEVRFLLIFVLTTGIFFRFINLDKKIVHFEEVYTLFRIAGYQDIEVVKELYDGRVIEVSDLLKYQHTSPQKSLLNTINSLAKEDSQHPPLYYIIARIWTEWFGTSVAVVRSLSAMISLFAFPCIYWLCLELFGEPIVGWTAVVLMAVSPFYVLFAQEMREYIFWAVTTLLSSAMLLRAMRLQTKFSWGIYAATVALGLYTFIFTVLNLLGHGIYVTLIERFRLTKVYLAYLIASMIGIIGFLPWLWIMFNNLSQIRDTTSQFTSRLPIKTILKSIFGSPRYIFIDMKPYLFFHNILGVLVLILVCYSIYFICHHTAWKVWLFDLILIGSVVLPLLLADLIIGGSRSTIYRYLITSLLGIQIAMAYLLANRLTSSYAKKWQQKLWQLIAIALISGGIVSCGISSQAVIWWNKDNSYNPDFANIINQAARPLVITDDRTKINQFTVTGDIMSLSYMLQPKVKLQLVVEPNIPKIPSGFSDIFLFNPSEALRKGLEKQNYKIELIYHTEQDKSFWKLSQS